MFEIVTGSSVCCALTNARTACERARKTLATGGREIADLELEKQVGEHTCVWVVMDTAGVATLDLTH
jgi:hypothetical protein